MKTWIEGSLNTKRILTKENKVSGSAIGLLIVALLKHIFNPVLLLTTRQHRADSKLALNAISMLYFMV